MDNLIKTELIINYIKQNNLSKTAFCRLCRISVSILDKIVAGEANVRIIALFKIVKMLEIKPCELFNCL